MGDKHTKNDREIGRVELREREKILNGHSSMWIKMQNLGQNHSHEQRMRDSKITHSNNIADMYLLYKDHKLTEDTRPVVTGCNSNTVGLSNMVSEFLESVANSVSEPYEAISSEDMLAQIVKINGDLQKIRDEALKAEKDIEEDDLKLIMIASDVVALFPSMLSENTGKIVRYEVEESEIETEGFDFKEVSRYVFINRRLTGDLGQLWRLLPRRRKTGGRCEPGMKNKEVKGRDAGTEESWIFPDTVPTALEERQLVARMAEIGVRTVFENFIYTFAGKMYIQQKGGPIGARVTMCLARIGMHDWGEQYCVILTRASLRIAKQLCG